MSRDVPYHSMRVVNLCGCSGDPVCVHAIVSRQRDAVNARNDDLVMLRRHWHAVGRYRMTMALCYGLTQTEAQIWTGTTKFSRRTTLRTGSISTYVEPSTMRMTP